MKYFPKTGVFLNKYGKKLNSYDKDKYLIVRYNKRQLMAHRVAWYLYYKEWPKGQIDHINGVRDDNRLSNLRVVTQRQNQQNRATHRKGRLSGTTYLKKIKKWVAQIQIDGKQKHIGCFCTELEAHEAYIKIVETI